MSQVLLISPESDSLGPTCGGCGAGGGACVREG